MASLVSLTEFYGPPYNEEEVPVSACAQCGEPHSQPGTLCGWCLDHISRALVRDELDDGSEDLSLSEALQWGEKHELFVA